MKQQVKKRLGAAHVRDTLEQFVSGEITRFQAMESLRIGKSRLYELKTQYLAARAEGNVGDWVPPSSGGNHMPAWPDKAQTFLKKVQSPDGSAKRYSYAFAASELGRNHDFYVDRSQVRHWALSHGIQPAVPKPPAACACASLATQVDRRALAARCDARLFPRAGQARAAAAGHA